MNEVKRLCDSVLMMKDGEIIDQGTPNELIQKHGRKNLEEVFLKDLQVLVCLQDNLFYFLGYQFYKVFHIQINFV